MDFGYLKSALSRTKEQAQNVYDHNPDADIACNIVDILFNQTNDSLKRDRSSIKLNMFEKGVVSSGLKRVLPGTKEFILGMYSAELNVLLDDIEKELIRRNKNLNINNVLQENFRLRQNLNIALQKNNEMEKKRGKQI